jgi:molecular chaperone GrpE
METRDQHATSEAQRAEHASAVPEEETTDERGSTTARESAVASEDDDITPEAPAEQELTLEALQEQLAEQGQKAEEYFDQLQRLQADFQNYRRRMTQERLEAASRGKEDVLRGLVPVLNNFRLALQHADQDANAVRQGVQMIWQQFEGFLRDQKVEPIPTVGQVFDPAYHEVLSTVPATAETPANTIVTEVKAGYRIDGRLLAPAQVIVARAEEEGLAVQEAPATSEAPGVAFSGS